MYHHFDRLAASIKFPERKISFKFKEKDMYINAQESGSTIPLVNDQAFDKSIKSSISAYMIFVKDSLNGVDETQVNENGMQVDLELSNFLNQFQDVFIDDIPGELPPKTGDDDHMIELIPGSSPPKIPPYRVSRAQQEEIMRQVNELVEKGVVRSSSSPFCSPVLLVQKKDGTYRMCVNYRALNRITIKNRFPVPRVEDLFDKLQGSTYFSRIDLKSGYHQIRIVDEDIVKIAFRTTFGLYEYLVMPFGLTNAPATFNCMMERIFQPHRNFTGVSFDDVIIYSKTIEEHKEHLKDFWLETAELVSFMVQDSWLETAELDWLAVQVQVVSGSDSADLVLFRYRLSLVQDRLLVTVQVQVVSGSGLVTGQCRKLEREKHTVEQRATQLTKEKIKEALSRKAEEPVLEPTQGSPKRPRQEEEEDMEHIQADPIPPSPINIPPAPPSSPITPFPPASTPQTPPSPSPMDIPKSPPAPTSPQQQPFSVEPCEIPTSLPEETAQPMDKTEEKQTPQQMLMSQF
ncbi:hypothetical protein L7F22_004595 [Adiantum nelumboides]|nr:hypothetical protein [Adiantum nelumboides]